MIEIINGIKSIPAAVIIGGTIDGTVIGGNTPAAGSFTTLNSSDLAASKPVFTDASKNLVSTGTLSVNQGGTGATSLTSHSVLVGSGTVAITALTAGTAGQILTGVNGADPVFSSTISTTKVTIAGTSAPALVISQTSITGTDNQAIDIIGGEILNADEHWTGIRVKPDDISPNGADTKIRGMAIDLSGVDVSGNVPESMVGLRIKMPKGLTGVTRDAVDAIFIECGDIDHNYSVPDTDYDQFTAYDFVVDASELAANSEIHIIDMAVAGGDPSGAVVGLTTHAYVAPIHQHIGSYSSVDQDTFAGKYTSSAWVDGSIGAGNEDLNGHEVFKFNGDWIAIGAAAQFAELEVIMRDGASKHITFEYFYSSGASADNWTQFLAQDDTIGFQQSGLLRWNLANITGAWTAFGAPGGGESTAGYYIKIVRTSGPDPGTPIPETIKTGTTILYEWDEDGDLLIRDLVCTNMDGIVGGNTPADGIFTDLEGLTPVITQGGTDTLTAAECKGQIILVTGAYTQTLPTNAEGAGAGSLTTLRATTAAVFHAKAGSGENIILSGVALDNGDKASSPGNVGNQITLWKSDASTWAEIGMIGGFVDGGA